MGNELTGDQQSGEVINNVLTKFVSNPEILKNEEKPPSVTNNYARIRNSRFVRGDERNGYSPGYQVQSQGQDQSVSPGRGFGNPGIVSVVRPGVYGNPMQASSVGQPTVRRQQRVEPAKPFNIFQQLFGGEKSEPEAKPRSISASHLSASNANRKITLLQSNLQISQQKLQSQNKAIQSMSKTIESLQQLVRTSESKAINLDQNSQKQAQRCQYLEAQLQGLQQEIQRLTGILGQKDGQLGQKDAMLYNKDKYISELEIQTRTQRSQIGLQDSRLGEYAVREERKDKEIRDISLAKFQLNAIKIRLQNNLKVMQDHLNQKDKQIAQLELTITRKTKQLQTLKSQCQQHQQSISHLNTELQHNIARNEEEKTILNSTIRGHLLTIDQGEARILELTGKIDKFYQNQMENQRVVRDLEDQLGEGKEEVERLMGDKGRLQGEIVAMKEDLERVRLGYEQERMETLKHREVGEKILNDYNNARKVGQKQIEFLENKLEELTRQKQRLAEELQITKTVAVQRNKVFQRSIIYELKQENDRLWAKLIDKSNAEADFEKDDPTYWKTKIEEHRNQARREQMQGSRVGLDRSKNQLEARFAEFVKKLDGNGENPENREMRESGVITRDVSSQSLSKLQQNVEFYRQKCNELEKMVESHIVLNKNLKDQIEKYTNYEMAFQVYRTQLDETKALNKELKGQNSKLKETLNTIQPEAQLRQKRSQNKSKDLEAQNKRFFEDIEKIKKELETSRTESRRFAEQNSCLNNQMNVYKKWQSLYDELKVRYDSLMQNSKEDYKGMYEELHKELERLRGLYEMKEGDYEKLKRNNSQRLETLEKEVKLRSNEAQNAQDNYQSLQRELNAKRMQCQNLIKTLNQLENKLNEQRQTRDRTTVDKETLTKLLAILRQKINELENLIKQIKEASADPTRSQTISQLAVACEKLLTNCLADWNKALGQ